MNYYIDTFGCQMNVHESEGIEGVLQMSGYQKTDDQSKADLIIFNTCCIRQSAENRVYGNIGALKTLKKTNPQLIIAIVGCMASKIGMVEKIQKSYPFVDIILGTGRMNRIVESVNDVKNGLKVYDTSTQQGEEHDETFLRQEGVSAWVSITQGCDKYCTYCIVPYVRGREISRDSQKIIEECKDLLTKGYKEITLLGQNVDSYKHNGIDFADLLGQIDNLGYKFRLKYMTSHPIDFNNKVIDTIAKSKNIAHNVHLPLQAGSDKVLKFMNRKYTAEYYLDRVARLRIALPQVSMTTDIMVGFPGETDEDFQKTIDIIKQVRFSNIYSFIYSAREGTPAAKMDNKIDIATKRARIKQLLEVQNQIAREIAEQQVGKTTEILCTQTAPTLIGKTRDDKIVTMNNANLQLGQFATVKIMGTKNSGLIAELLHHPNQLAKEIEQAV